MRRNRRVKIVATLGPASNNEKMIRALFEAGADVFRINMSHATPEALRQAHAIIRKIEAEFSRPIGILIDLQGPKLRIGKFRSGAIRLTEGDILSFVRRESVGGLGRVHLPHPEIFQAVQPGHALLLDDGKLRLRGRRGERRAHRCRGADQRNAWQPQGHQPARHGHSARGHDRQGPRRSRRCAQPSASTGSHLSFVQRGKDIAEARKLVRGRAAIMAKIEKPSALAELEEIIDLADGIMVARGDLGVEMPVEKVPGLQKQITRAARNAGKPVVVATQMLESMILSPAPTRAEVSDVATAVFDGADAVMLSAESAVGKYPVEAVATMDRVAIEVERDPALREDHSRPAHRSGGDRRRRHFSRRAHRHRDAQSRGDHLLHGLRRDEPPRRPRAAAAADHCADPNPRHRPQARRGLGPALRADRRSQRPRRHGGEGLPHRLPGRLRAPRAAGHHLRRRAARHPGATNMLRIAFVGEESPEAQ